MARRLASKPRHLPRPHTSSASLVWVARHLAATPSLWLPHVPAPGDGRAYARLVATSAYEAWLLTWSPGARVQPHDHGDSKGVLAVVDGTLDEIRYVDGREYQRQLTRGDVYPIARGVVHDVVAQGPLPATSIHVYSPRLAAMAFFDPTGRWVDDVRDVAPGSAILDAGDLLDEWRADPVTGVDEALAWARHRIAPRVDARELTQLIDDGALVVDIRPERLRTRDGELPGAVVIERNVLEWRLEPDGADRLPQFVGRDQVVVLVCDEGYASSLAAATLRDLGVQHATDLIGGFQAWRAAVVSQHR